MDKDSDNSDNALSLAAAEVAVLSLLCLLMGCISRKAKPPEEAVFWRARLAAVRIEEVVVQNMAATNATKLMAEVLHDVWPERDRMPRIRFHDAGRISVAKGACPRQYTKMMEKFVREYSAAASADWAQPEGVAVSLTDHSLLGVVQSIVELSGVNADIMVGDEWVRLVSYYPKPDLVCSLYQATPEGALDRFEVEGKMAIDVFLCGIPAQGRPQRVTRIPETDSFLYIGSPDQHKSMLRHMSKFLDVRCFGDDDRSPASPPKE